LQEVDGKKMQLKPIAAITVLLLVVASLLVAGCTTSTTSNTNQSPSATTSTATHDAFLENYITADKNYTSNYGNLTSWKITWINSTSARVEWIAVNKTENQTMSSTITDTYILFPTTQDATKYLNAMNKTGYNLTTSNYSYNPPYKTVTGSDPAVFKLYTQTAQLQNTSMSFYYIRQQDRLIDEGILKGTNS
jgi:hypothetical protein